MPDKKRIALITGASSGLGREFARLLAREAVDELWLVARCGERLRELSAELAVPCRIFALDLTQEAALEELSAALSAEPPVVRYLVNAAGFGRIGMAADIGAATTGRMIALNCRAAAELTERALPYMERGSRVLEIGLVRGVPAHPVPRGVCGDESLPPALQPRAGSGGRSARHHGHGHLPVLDPRHGVHPRGQEDGPARPLPGLPARDGPEDRRPPFPLGRGARLHRLYAGPRLDPAPRRHVHPAAPLDDRPEQPLAPSGGLREM